MKPSLSSFKAYDIRGRVPDEVNADLAYRIGSACAHFLNPHMVVVGYDVRLSSPELAGALIRGLTEEGADVTDIGLCGTEEVYFQTFHQKADGGIIVTASHNPIDYNGMKLVREESRPISKDTGLNEIEGLVKQGISPRKAGATGRIIHAPEKTDYIHHLLGYVDRSILRSLKIVVNAGNGCAGPVLDLLSEHLPFEFIRINHEPDGTFPNGIPNPLLPENRSATATKVLEHGADLGIAWDGDFDRCFLFDEHARFIEGYYIIGLLAQVLLGKKPGSKIIHDPRLTWNTIDTVLRNGGVPVLSKAGHAFMKERMRGEDGLYGGEMSGHHYFRDFSYCDSGMIPWLLVAEHICRTGRPISALVDERMKRYPCSGEVNFRVKEPALVLQRILSHYEPLKPVVDHMDGVSLEFPNWRLNLRPSNTEPLLRLNVETKGDETLLGQKTQEIMMLVKQV
jgi:phosphomannomutase/phosphoglucomutase